jgi:hypothetical protein
MHHILDFRVGGIVAKNFRIFKQLYRDQALKNIVIVTNMWGEVSLEVRGVWEQELKTNIKFSNMQLTRVRALYLTTTPSIVPQDLARGHEKAANYSRHSGRND